MDNKLMAQRFSDQAPNAKYVQRVASDSSMPADVRSVKPRKYTTDLYHDQKTFAIFSQKGGDVLFENFIY